MSLGEFELIRRYFAQHCTDPSVLLGVGDDCALLQPPAGQQLALSIDTMVEGTHFPAGTAPELIASRLLGAAVSDLAAMGAEPAWLTLALTLPTADADWLQAFSKSLLQRCHQWGLSLIGGDTTRGPLCLSAQVHGFVPQGQALTRQGAQPDDLIVVSGTLGDSRAGLDTLLNQQPDAPAVQQLQQRFYAPQPRLKLGQSLRGLASSCIDISDGLLADLGHLLTAGNLGAELELEKLPLSEALIQVFPIPVCRDWALSGGEDFELCFTLAENQLNNLPADELSLTVIGRISSEPGIRLLLEGQPQPVGLSGYDHFSGSSDE